MKTKIKKQNRSEGEIEVSGPTVIEITETRVDEVGNEYNYTRKEFVSVEQLEAQMASHQAEIDKIQEKLDLIR